MGTKAKLNDKQVFFCKEYIVDFNATQAAIRTGYSEKTANRIASQLLSKLDIQELIAEYVKERSERVQIDADWVLVSAKQVFDRCMQHEKVTDKSGEPVLDNDGNPVYKFEPNAANKSLEIIGKHVKVRAFEKEEKKEDNKDTTIVLNFTDAAKPDAD